MTAPVTYARRWGDEEVAPAAPPEVLISSRDDAPLPRVAGAVKLAALAEQHGFAVRVTYALAAVPERLYLNGNVAKAAHRLASVAVRLAHGVVRGYAVWHNEDERGWRFVSAWLGTTRYGLRAIKEVVSGRPVGDEPTSAGSTEGGAERLTGAGPALIPTLVGAP